MMHTCLAEKTCGINIQQTYRTVVAKPLLKLELELGLIQSHMTQKPVLRGEVDARALRV